MSGLIRVGIGGWTYEPWRQSFYPADVPKARELEYASRQLTAIEVNGTFYRLQKPQTFARWRDETPDDFVFTLKAPRYIVNRTELAPAARYIDRFIHGGLSELRAKLGPILWQLAPEYRFQSEDLERFLDALPADLDGRPLKHALEVRHESFRCQHFFDIAAQRGVAVVYSDSEKQPCLEAASGSFFYARLKRAQAAIETGYRVADLEAWAAKARAWSAGPRDGYVFFINGAKERAPAAARALIKRLCA